MSFFTPAAARLSAIDGSTSTDSPLNLRARSTQLQVSGDFQLHGLWAVPSGLGWNGSASGFFSLTPTSRRWSAIHSRAMSDRSLWLSFTG